MCLHEPPQAQEMTIDYLWFMGSDEQKSNEEKASDITLPSSLTSDRERSRCFCQWCIEHKLYSDIEYVDSALESTLNPWPEMTHVTEGLTIPPPAPFAQMSVESIPADLVLLRPDSPTF